MTTVKPKTLRLGNCDIPLLSLSIKHSDHLGHDALHGRLPFQHHVRLVHPHYITHFGTPQLSHASHNHFTHNNLPPMIYGHCHVTIWHLTLSCCMYEFYSGYVVFFVKIIGICRYIFLDSTSLGISKKKARIVKVKMYLAQRYIFTAKLDATFYNCKGIKTPIQKKRVLYANTLYHTEQWNKRIETTIACFVCCLVWNFV